MPLFQKHITAHNHVYIPLQPHTCQLKFSWRSELRHFISRKFLNLFLWPVFKFKQREFTSSQLFKNCCHLPGFTDLWKTIQKGAFAYNTLFLETHPYRYSRTLDIADITTLALFFGDEFIDGISATAGKQFISQLISADKEKFYLKKKNRKDRVILEYNFNLFHILPANIWNSKNEKYQISYRRLYILLQHFLTLINEQLGKMPHDDAQIAADKILDACNTCFKSFLHDVDNGAARGDIPTIPLVLQFHETKTAYMQTKLLELRCTLAKKEDAMNSVQMPGWLDIMRVIQIYDDIHDIVIDDGVQDNLMISIAYHYFPDEWKWFDTNKHHLKEEKQSPVLLSLYMPSCLEYCMNLAGEKIKKMNWEQQKIMHYLIFKNKYVLYDEKKDTIFKNNASFLLQFYHSVKNRMAHLPAETIKSYIVNTCMHLPAMRKQLLRKVNFTIAYQLKYNLLSLPAERKAAVFDMITIK